METITPEHLVDYTKYLKRSNIHGTKLTHKNLLYSIAYQLQETGMLTDIGNIDYSKDRGPTLMDPTVLRKAFCDNIMLVKLIPANTITKQNYTTLTSDGTSRLHATTKTFIESKNLYYHGDVKARRTCKTSFNAGATLPTPTIEEERELMVEFSDIVLQRMEGYTIRAVENMLRRHPDRVAAYLQRYPEDAQSQVGFISYKVGFAQYDFDVAIKYLQVCKGTLAHDLFYVTEFDATTDLSCGFDKLEVEMFFSKIKDYGFVDNDQGVGKQCFTVMSTSLDTPMRCKGYNKFVQSLETKNVVSPVGTHLDNWINNPEENLANTIEGCLENGFTRLEITFYKTTVQEDQGRNFLKEVEKFLQLLCTGCLFFSLPIDRQWCSIAAELTHSIAIYDEETFEFVIAFWCNSYTGRVGGSFGNLTEGQASNPERAKTRLLSRFSFRGNIPMHYITVTRKGMDTSFGYFSISSYLRIDNGVTYVIGSEKQGCLTISNYLGRHPSTPQSRGLVSTPQCEFHIPSSRQNIADRYPDNYDKLAFVYPSFSALGSRSVIDVECNVDNIETVHQRAMVESIGNRYRNAFRRYPRSGKYYYIPLSSVEDGIVLKIFAFTPREESYPCYIMLAEDKRLYRTNIQVATFLDKNKGKFIVSHGTYFWGPEQCYIFSFKKLRNYRNTEHNTRCTEVSNICINPHLVMQGDPNMGGKLQYTNLDVEALTEAMASSSITETELGNEIPSTITWSTSVPDVGELPAGTYTVTSIRPKTYRGAERYFLYINGRTQKSSFLCEDLLNETDSEGLSLYKRICTNNKVFRIVVSEQRKTYRRKMQNVLAI